MNTMISISQKKRQCKCDDPKCRKCLLVNCVDYDCKVHSKEGKTKAREWRLDQIQKQIEKLENPSEVKTLREERKALSLELMSLKPEEFIKNMYVHWLPGEETTLEKVKNETFRISIVVAVIIVLFLMTLGVIYIISWF